MNAYIDTIKVTDENGEKSILYPRTKQNAVEGLEERLAKLEVADITETEDTTLENSHAGRLLFTEINGAMDQGANPSPTNLQEIENVAISGIKTYGKNFFSFGKNTVDVTEELRPNRVQRLTLSMVDNDLNKIKCNYTGGGYSTGYIAIYGVDGTKDWAISYDIESNTTAYSPTLKKGKTNSSAERLVLTVVGGNNDTNVDSSQYFVLSNIQVEEGTVVTEYEPYTESTATLSQPIELYGMDDVQDVIEDGKIKRRFATIVFDGSDDEGWVYDKGVNRIYGNIIKSSAKWASSSSSKANILCSALISKSFNAVYSGSDGICMSTGGVLSLKYPTLTSLEMWKAYLASNPMTVVYERATETTEELPIVDQIALNSLATYDGITHVEFISDVQPTFKAKYGTTEMGGITLESLLTARNNDLRLSAVESAVINNI